VEGHLRIECAFVAAVGTQRMRIECAFVATVGTERVRRQCLKCYRAASSQGCRVILPTPLRFPLSAVD